MPEIALTMAVGDYGHTMPLKEGSVGPQGLALQPVEVPSLVDLVRRMTRGLEFDIAEVSLGTYLPARTFHTRFTAIPVFPLRAFYHSAIVYRPQSEISTPSDLNGRRLGVNRGWTVTAGVWARAMLASEYGVDLSSVTWVTTGDDHVEKYKPPANVISAPPGAGLAELLAAGEIDAAVGLREVAGSLPLIAQPEAAERGYFERTGIYPINHTVVVRDELLDSEPWIADTLFSAFQEAKERYLEQLHAEGASSPQDQAMLGRIQKVGPDPLPYGIEPNRATLDALIDASVEQGIIPERVSVDELFTVGV
jgi:4,5-dihydroxyphthalate decarboxylase